MLSELIDLRSFTSLWFWIVVAVFWSARSHNVVGVPFDLVERAGRPNSGFDWDDLHDVTRVAVKRRLLIGRRVGPVIAALGGFVIASLFSLGFLYGVEFAQALFFLVFPSAIVGLLGQRAALVIARDGLQQDALVRRLRRHRLATQGIGMLAIFATAFWGMFHAMASGVLGG